MLRNVVGVVVSAAIVGALYLGPAIAGLIWGMIPHYVVEDLAVPERRVVYDGAWEVSDVERPGDMDGTLNAAGETEAAVADAADGGADGSGQGGGDGAAGDGVDGDGKAATDSLAVVRPGGKAGGTGTGAGRGTKRGVDTEAAAAAATRRAEEEAAEQAGRPRRQSRSKCPRTFDGIQKRKDGVYEVSRELVTYHSSSVARFNELGWSKPNDEGDGKGWYITGFGCRDALWHAGLRRKDIILTVNGKKTNNMMQVLMLYTKVKAQKHFTVRVKRNAKELTFRYEVVK